MRSRARPPTFIRGPDYRTRASPGIRASPAAIHSDLSDLSEVSKDNHYHTENCIKFHKYTHILLFTYGTQISTVKNKIQNLIKLDTYYVDYSIIELHIDIRCPHIMLRFLSPAENHFYPYQLYFYKTIYKGVHKYNKKKYFIQLIYYNMKGSKQQCNHN